MVLRPIIILQNISLDKVNRSEEILEYSSQYINTNNFSEIKFHFYYITILFNNA
jgi:hypothetical protein